MVTPVQPLFYMLCYILVMYLRPHEFIPELMDVPLMPTFLGLSLLLWLTRQPNKNFAAPHFGLLIAMMCVMFISVLLTNGFSPAWAATTDFMPVALTFFMLATTIDSVAKLRAVFVVMGFIVVVIAHHSIGQAETGVGWTGATLVDERIAYLGYLNDPNELSMVFLMTLPMVLYMAGRSGKLMKLVWWTVAGLLLYTVKLGNSRGAVLSFCAIMFQYGIFRFGLFKSLLVGPFALLPVIIFGPSRANEISADEESAEGRIEAWHEGFQMLREHPLFGVGKGLFVDHNSLTAHNSYVLAMAEMGTIGFHVWFSFVVLTWLMCKRVYDAGPGAPAVGTQAEWDEVREASRIVWYGFTSMLVSIFFLSRSYVPFIYYHMAMVVAMYQLARKMRPDIEEIKYSNRFGWLVKVTILGIVGLYITKTVLLH
jgi:O-antigen ligase